MRGNRGPRRLTMRRRGLGVALGCLLTALTIGGVALAAASDSSKGNGALDNGNGTFDNFSVYAKSGPAGEKPSGSVFVDFVATSRQSGATLGNGTVRGDVGGGCVYTAGNRSAVLGRLREPVTIPNVGRIEFAGVTLEDNGAAGDRAEIWVFQGEAARANFCAGGFLAFGFWRAVSGGYVEVIDS